ncbi:MAG TPA: hypothetical protein PKD55_05565 [Bellilinea sp.]|nr:hypothetical protein [Bellilinea sp.]
MSFFWDVATSSIVLSMIALLLIAALVVGYFPLLKWFPVLGQYVPVARLASILVAALLSFLFGYKVADDRAATAALRNELAVARIDLAAAHKAADQADAARRELAAQSITDQVRIEKYAEELKKRPNAACTLTDDDFAGRM